MSTEYLKFTMSVLSELFSIDKLSREQAFKKLLSYKQFYNKNIMLEFRKKYRLDRKNMLKHDNFKTEVLEKNPVIYELYQKKEVDISKDNSRKMKKIHLGNQEDILMVLDILKFVSEEAPNIFLYLSELVKSGHLVKAYEKLNNIRAISDKLATFVLRDVCILSKYLQLV